MQPKLDFILVDRLEIGKYPFLKSECNLPSLDGET